MNRAVSSNHREPADVVFLPGMMCDERLFASQLRTVGRLARTRTVRFDVGDSIEAFASTALELGEADGRIVPVGLSMGGIVAMECIRQRPERIAGLVLIDTNPLSEPPERQAVRIGQIERALDGELDSLLIEEMKPHYLAPGNRDDLRILDCVLDMARSLGPEVFVRQSRALAARLDYSSVLQQWHGPTLLICGRHDTLCPPARHRYLQELMPHAALEILSEAGHLPTLECPARVDGLLVDFLGSTLAP